MTCREPVELINEDVFILINEFNASIAAKEALNIISTGDMYPDDYGE